MNDDDLNKLRESLRRMTDGLNLDYIAKIVNDMPKIVIPELPKLDYSNLFPSNAQELVKQIAAFAKQQADAFSSTLKAIDFSNLYPPNWKNGKNVLSFPQDLELIVADGIPLAYVPPYHVLEKIFTSTSTSQRRKILSDNHKSIVDSCGCIIDTIKEKELRQYQIFTKESIKAFNDGNWRASQALSTSILDSFLHKHFSKNVRIKMVDQKSPIDWKKLPTHLAFTIGAISANYGQYYPENGDKIPKKYSRHASVHGLSVRQYSKLNSLIALMTVVSLLKSIEASFLRKHRN